MNWPILITGTITLVITIFSIIKYVYLNKKYPDSLRVFSISIIAYILMCILFSIVEYIIYIHTTFNNEISGRVALYAVITFIHIVFVVSLYALVSIRIVLYDDYFTYHNIVGIRKKVLYKDVIKLEINDENGKYIIYTKKRKIAVPYFVADQQKLDIFKNIQDKEF